MFDSNYQKVAPKLKCYLFIILKIYKSPHFMDKTYRR